MTVLKLYEYSESLQYVLGCFGCICIIALCITTRKFPSMEMMQKTSTDYYIPFALRRAVRLSLACVVCLQSFFMFGCGDEDSQQNEENVETAVSGSAEILVDNSIFPLISSIKPIYDSVYPNAHITLIPVTAYEAVAALLAGESRGIVVAREFTNYEDSLMKAYNVPLPQRYDLATDALTLFTPKQYPLDTISKEEIQRLLLSSAPGTTLLPKGNEKVLYPGYRSSVYANILKLVVSGKAPSYPMQTYANADSLLTAVRNGSGIGFGYLSQILKDSSLKMLRIGFEDSTGKRIPPRVVHQANIVRGFYPYPVPIAAYLRDVSRPKLPYGFFTFLRTDSKAQRMFLNAGIVPAFATFNLILQD